MMKFYWTILMACATCMTANAQTFSMVKDISSGTSSSVPQKLTNINGSLFFVGTNPANGYELWKTDGTASGTLMIKDIYPGPLASSPDYFTHVNDITFFTAHDPVNGNELWKTDGTASGTVLVKDIYPGSTGSSPINLININGILFFRAHTAAHGYELWKTNGTEAGTVMVKNIYPGAGSSAPSSLTSSTFSANVNGIIYFMADDGVSGQELWKSDGTEAGTIMVKDINPGAAHASPAHLINAGGKLIFLANNGTHGAELWRTDGSNAGTTMLKDINPGMSSGFPQSFINFGGTIFFTVDDGHSGTELWKTNGTENGTILIKDINTGINSSSPQNLTICNGFLFFTANNAASGRELWKSDGSNAGTAMVKDINPGTRDGVHDFTAINNKIFLNADDGVYGHELWISDGTLASTFMVQDIMPGGTGSDPGDITGINGKIFLSAHTNAYGRELWTGYVYIPIGGLPLTMLDFKGHLTGLDEELQWKTVAEQNTSHFEIERNIDGRNFTKVGTLPAAGNSASTKLYSYTDRNITTLNASAIYYRLKMKDNDGKFTYSKIIAVSIRSNKAAIMLYPNPVSESATLIIAGTEKENITYSIIDHHGRTIQRESITIDKGSNSVLINTNYLAAGVYTMSIHGNYISQQLKFIKP